MVEIVMRRVAYSPYMARDATPNDLELVKDKFANENHERIARIILKEWGPDATFSDISSEYQGHRSTFQDVYKRYLGPVDSGMTVEEIKQEFGSMKKFLEMREAGDPRVTGEEEDPKVDMTEQELVAFKEGVRKGYSDGYKDGLQDAEAN